MSSTQMVHQQFKKHRMCQKVCVQLSFCLPGSQNQSTNDEYCLLLSHDDASLLTFDKRLLWSTVNFCVVHQTCQDLDLFHGLYNRSSNQSPDMRHVQWFFLGQESKLSKLEKRFVHRQGMEDGMTEMDKWPGAFCISLGEYLPKVVFMHQAEPRSAGEWHQYKLTCETRLENCVSLWAKIRH